METEFIKKLLAELESAQYIAVLRTLNQVNGKLRIPGFTKMEKAPIAMVVTAAKNSEEFKMALLTSVIRVVSPELKINVEDDLQDLKGKVARDQWLGLAACLITDGSKQALEKAEDILIGYRQPMEKENIHKNIELLDGSEKKEEKFRLKYMKTHEELVLSQKELSDKTREVQEWQQKYQTLSKRNETLAQQCIELSKKIEQLNEKQKKMNDDITKLRNTTEENARVEQHIFAPNCQDLLEKFSSKMRIDFVLPETMKLENVIENYDQVWVFPDLVSFGDYRVFRKLQNINSDKISIFQSLSSLISHAYRMSE